MTNSYREYRKKVLDMLVHEINSKGKQLKGGMWKGKGPYYHILPIDGVSTRNSRIAAIKKYLDIEIDDFLPKKKENSRECVHPYIHHLNSSQLLCFSVFRNMINDDHSPKIQLIELMKKLGIDISTKAYCEFEYSDDMMYGNEKEGTSFDFHIIDEDKEFFFEIKFTEAGFGKAVIDERHSSKIEQCYLEKINKCPDIMNSLLNVYIEDVAKNYQLFRNIIRSGDKKTVIFLIDENNPATKKEIKCFQEQYLVKYP